jgi:hypothetical protein
MVYSLKQFEYVFENFYSFEATNISYSKVKGF